MNKSPLKNLNSLLRCGLSALGMFGWIACNKSSSEGPRLPHSDVLTFCQFGPKVTVHEESRETDSREPCRATAKIQGVYWQCSSPEKYQDRLWQYHRSLMSEGEKACMNFCEGISDQCRGVFRQQERCGLSLGLDDAKDSGQKLGCRKNCEGQALAYCSIYNAGFMTYDKGLMNAKSPNCICLKRKS